MMKSIKYITFALLAILIMSSCEKERPANDKPADWPIFSGYMQFSTGVSTRASLATNMREKSFGVIGYEYSVTTNWDAAKAIATPETFYNQEVNCNSDGFCSYDTDLIKDGDQLKPWESDKKYSFFAYHPYKGNGITLSAKEAVNTPTLTYTYPWLSKINEDGVLNVASPSFNDMYDLMTAEAIDLDGSGNVNLEFKHRLFAVEVLACNYNESTFEVDGSENKVYSVDANKVIKGLHLYVKGLANQSIEIPLSMLTGEAPKPDGKPLEDALSHEDLKTDGLKFALQTTSVKIPAFNEPIYDDAGNIIGGQGVAISISKNGSDNKKGYLMFIPQEKQDLTFTLYWDDISSTEWKDRTVTSTMKFEAGKLYQIIINFIGSGITIALIEAGAWDSQDVYHTFE